ncbi:TPA: hypothetical protein DIV55_07050 [Patescibacteria group bacterium]|nr:hypothetical protein [Patescibacteria group bacterium]
MKSTKSIHFAKRSLSMKKITFTVLVFSVLFAFMQSPTKVYADWSQIVGNESHEVSWHGMPSSDQGDKYQVFFGQADGNKEAYSVFEGLDNRSFSVRLNHLKPCTQYSWSLKSRRGGNWSWVIRDRRFTTGGVCETPKVAQSAGASMVNTVSKQKMGDATYGTSTVSWSALKDATSYFIYYGQKKGGPYEHSLKVPGTGTNAIISSLQAGVTYYYRVAAEVGGQLRWYSEKMLQTTTGEKPVLGVQTGGSALAMTSVRVCTNSGRADVSVRIPGGVTVSKVHIFYGGSKNYLHAVRDLEPTVREVRIGNLDTCANYYYQVAILGNDGKVYWQGEKMLSVMP